MLNFLLENRKTLKLKPLTEAFNKRFGLNKSRISIHSALRRRNIYSSNPQYTRLLTKEEEDFAREKYKELSQYELLEALRDKFGVDLKIHQLRSYLKNHGIRSGRKSGFKKGHTPWHAGTKGVFPAVKTSYRKYQLPTNKRPIGTERVNSEGYIEVKVSDRNPYNNSKAGWFRMKQIVVWEEANGPIPKGKVVKFKDGNRKNVVLENLMLLSRAENMRLTHLKYTEKPEELKPTVLAIAKLEQAALDRERENE